MNEKRRRWRGQKFWKKSVHFLWTASYLWDLDIVHKRYVDNVMCMLRGVLSISVSQPKQRCKMFKFISIVLATCITISNACKCPLRSDDQKFCDSKFAGVIKVKSAAEPCGTQETSICYGISIQRQIRGAASSATTLQFPSEDLSPGCSVSLTPGQIYFITANVVRATHPDIIGSISCEVHHKLTSSGAIDKVIRHYQSLKCRGWISTPPMYRV